MAKYSKGAGKKVEKVMKEKKAGTLKSGSGAKVTSSKQAIAIGLSEARKQGSKVPKKAAAKKTAPKKAAAKKAAPKKVAAKKAAPKKSAAKKSPAKKAAPKKAAAKRSAPAKKSAPKKVAVKKAAPKKAAPKKAAPVKKSAPKKVAAPAKKSTPKKSAPTKSTAPVKVAPKKAPFKRTNNPLPSPSQMDDMLDDNNETSMPETRDASSLPQADNPSGIGIPTEENTEKHIPQEEPHEPSENNPVQASHGAPIPPDKYAAAKDTYHGHVNPSSSKSKIKPSGKKPLWNS